MQVYVRDKESLERKQSDTRTFRDFQLDMGIHVVFSQPDEDELMLALPLRCPEDVLDYRFNCAQHVPELITFAKYHALWSISYYLIREKINIANLIDWPDYPLYQALQAGSNELLTYLGSLPIEGLRQLGPATELNHWVMCFSIGGIEALEYLFTACLPDSANYLDELYRWAAKVGHTALVVRLLQEPSILNMAAAHQNFALRHAAANGHVQTVKLLLSIDEVHQNAHAEHNEALNMACANGHIDIVELLLAVAAVQARIFYFNNLALYSAAQTGRSALAHRDDYRLDRMLTPEIVAQLEVRQQSRSGAKTFDYLEIVNRLLEFKAVRQSDLSWNVRPRPPNRHTLEHVDSVAGLNKHYIVYGLKRAFWLELQTATLFDTINDLVELRDFANNYLKRHDYWMSVNPYLDYQSLVGSLKPQVLSLHYYDHSTYLKTCPDGPRSSIQQFICLPRSIEYFNESPFNATRELAERCLKSWITLAEHKHKKIDEMIARDDESGGGSYRLFISYLGYKRTVDRVPNQPHKVLKRFGR